MILLFPLASDGKVSMSCLVVLLEGLRIKKSELVLFLKIKSKTKKDYKVVE